MMEIIAGLLVVQTGLLAGIFLRLGDHGARLKALERYTCTQERSAA